MPHIRKLSPAEVIFIALFALGIGYITFQITFDVWRPWPLLGRGSTALLFGAIFGLILSIIALLEGLRMVSPRRTIRNANAAVRAAQIIARPRRTQRLDTYELLQHAQDPVLCTSRDRMKTALRDNLVAAFSEQFANGDWVDDAQAEELKDFHLWDIDEMVRNLPPLTADEFTTLGAISLDQRRILMLRFIQIATSALPGIVEKAEDLTFQKMITEHDLIALDLYDRNAPMPPAEKMTSDENYVLLTP